MAAPFEPVIAGSPPARLRTPRAWSSNRAVKEELSMTPGAPRGAVANNRSATLLRHVGTGLGDLAILNRGCAGDADGPDNLAMSRALAYLQLVSRTCR